MARPTNNSAEYFSHDADMRNDIKVKALRRKFGHTGYAVWNYILETLTDSNDFELDFSEVNRELLAADYEVTVEELYDIVKYACKINLLQASEDETVIYSSVLKKRFAKLIEQRERRCQAGKKGMESRWCNDNNVIKNTKSSITKNNNVITNDSNAIKNDNNVIENTENTITKNNKVKYSKVKETIVKETKEKKNIYPYQDIVALWNEICGVSLPQVKSLNDSRRQKIKSRIDEFECKSNEDCLNKVKEIFERIRGSDFLCGENNSGWTATFDWVFDNSKNWIKVIEGNYDNNRSAKNTQQNILPGVALGVGEYIETQTGRRTYGTGKATIPHTAPARPSEKYCWDSVSSSWVLL